MTDSHDVENATATHEAADSAGRPHARSSRAGDIEGGLMRYLAAEAYHEKVEEDREKKSEDEQGQRR